MFVRTVLNFPARQPHVVTRLVHGLGAHPEARVVGVDDGRHVTCEPVVFGARGDLCETTIERLAEHLSLSEWQLVPRQQVLLPERSSSEPDC